MIHAFGCFASEPLVTSGGDSYALPVSSVPGRTTSASTSRATAPSYSDYSFILVTPDTTRLAPVVSDKEFYRLSTSVYFKVNKTDISPDDPFFELYRNEILPMINDSHLQLRKVYIRGAASPEGPYANNQRLGRGRTQALLTELKRNLKHQYINTDIELTSVTEDYGYLCVLMEEASDPDLGYVSSLCASVDWDELKCKKLLMNARGGKLWKRLLKEYFPKLRAARMLLWFSEPDADHAPTPAIAVAPARPAELLATSALMPVRTPQTEIPADTAWTRRHLIALRTNLVHDFFYMPQVGFCPSPNLQLEYYPLDGHWTANLGVTWGSHRNWDDHKFFQVRDFQLEARRYFRGHGEFTGLYLGAFLHGDVYGIGLNADTGWEGEGAGAGISLGYVLPLTRKGDFRLEFMIGAGAFLSRFDPYVFGNPVTGDVDGKYYYNYTGSVKDFKRRNHVLTWFGPTNVGIQLTYDIIYRRRKK